MTNRDDHFEFAGRIWQRSWSVDHYRWATGDGLAVGWNPPMPYDAGHDADGEVIVRYRRTHYAEVNGKRFGGFANVRAAMFEAVKAAMREAA